jgi:MoaA/NifB/PqqE/SkfB family radical SAM enzyme
MLDLLMLYRGPLSSCNYDCSYCPFAKHHETARELAIDRAALERFVDWVATRPDDRLGLFFTPWGEALVRRWYQQAFARLTHLPQVWRVAVQTNLSCRLDWINACDASKLGLWCTYHPTQIARDDFLAQCARLTAMNVRHSVGVVGVREHFDDIADLRAALPPTTYLWINAFKEVADYYDEQELESLLQIDPLFATNAQQHASEGRACQAGQTAVTIDGHGDIRRCHFLRDVIGNVYQPGWEAALQERPCTRATCGCHIGYVHLEHLRQHEVYGAGILERIPSS